MTQLQRIENYCDQLARAMAAILELEVVIIDEVLRIVAGTGIYGEKVGMQFDQNSVSHLVLTTGRKHVILNPRNHERCIKCQYRDSCPDLAEILLPIIINKEVIGVFAILALSRDQRQRLIDRENLLVEFVRKVSDLISFTIEAGKLTEKLAQLADEFDTVVNSVNDGIIALNEANEIVMVNDSAVKMLNISKERLLKRKISAVFNDPLLLESLQKGTAFLNREIYVKRKNKKYYFLGSLAPINGQDGHVLVIRNFAEVTQMVGDYLLKEPMVTFDDIIGNSETTRQIKDLASQVARSDSTIIIQGESGVGKEIYARAIHAQSLRANGLFVAVNCGALPETLLESELFGYEDGAFSGAKRGGKIGRFELADKGTLFLDEIGDLPLHLQVNFLRVLQEKKLERLGGTHPVSVDFRMIVATNRRLDHMVERGEFREDLYYRINVIPLTIPPLRERKDDIMALLDYYRRKYNALLGKNIAGYSDEALEQLLRYAWPGNVRELENAIDYAVNLEQGEVISIESLPENISAATSGDQADREGYRDFSLAEVEKKTIGNALNYFGRSAPDKEKAATALGIGIATLYRKIKHYRL